MDCCTSKRKEYQNDFGGIRSPHRYCILIFIDQGMPYESEGQSNSALGQVSTSI